MNQGDTIITNMLHLHHWSCSYYLPTDENQECMHITYQVSRKEWVWLTPYEAVHWWQWGLVESRWPWQWWLRFLQVGKKEMNLRGCAWALVAWCLYILVPCILKLKQIFIRVILWVDYIPGLGSGHTTGEGEGERVGLEGSSPSGWVLAVATSGSLGSEMGRNSSWLMMHNTLLRTVHIEGLWNQCGIQQKIMMFKLTHQLVPPSVQHIY